MGSEQTADLRQQIIWPQGRITDHRINKTIYSLDSFVNGDIQDMLDSLQFAENVEKMKAGETV